MPEEVFVEPKSTNWPKMILAAVLGFALLAGACYTGYRYGTQKFVADLSEKPAATPQPDQNTQTENWSIYTNEEYGFSVEYPTGWEVEEQSLSEKGSSYWVRDITTFEGDRTKIIVIIKETSEPLMEWARESYGVYALAVELADIPAQPNATIAGQPAIITHRPAKNPPDVQAALKSGDFVFIIRQSNFRNGTLPPFPWETYEHVLRTFEFEGTKDIIDELPIFPTNL